MSNPVNKIERQEFLNLFENVVEHTPKVAEELFKLRPFSSDEMFLKSLANVIAELSHEEKVQNKRYLFHFIHDLIALNVIAGGHSQRPP